MSKQVNVNTWSSVRKAQYSGPQCQRGRFHSGPLGHVDVEVGLTALEKLPVE